MSNKIICIAREFGSGGHEIAIRTAGKLGIRVYEKDLFHMACKYGELSDAVCGRDGNQSLPVSHRA